VFLGANLLAGASALSAGWLGNRIGLVQTMVYTHLPSNVLLMLVPLMPTSGWAIAVLLARFSISQMDVPTRQAYVMAVVPPAERSAAAGITGVARSLGAAISPMISARLIAIPGLLSLPFFLAGGIKIAYDLLIFRAFASLKPDRED
jgi:MFS family permease